MLDISQSITNIAWNQSLITRHVAFLTFDCGKHEEHGDDLPPHPISKKKKMAAGEIFLKEHPQK